MSDKKPEEAMTDIDRKIHTAIMENDYQALYAIGDRLLAAEGALEPLRVAVESYDERHAEFKKAPSNEGLDLVNAERGAIVDAAIALIREAREALGGGKG